MSAGFDTAWQQAHPALRRSLELAYESLAAGGLAAGSVLTDAQDRIVAEGRNRAYDPPGGRDVLQGTPLAHAEMNVLATVSTETELADCTLWSTHEPCSMCSAAVTFTGVGRVRYIAPDPSAVAADVPDTAARSSSAAGSPSDPADAVWLVTANVLFLHAVASKLGVAHSMLAGNREVEPETTGIVVDLISEGLTADALTNARPLTEVLPLLWHPIVTAATARTERTHR